MMRIGVAIENKDRRDGFSTAWYIRDQASTYYLRFGSGDSAQEVALTESEANTLLFLLSGMLRPSEPLGPPV